MWDIQKSSGVMVSRLRLSCRSAKWKKWNLRLSWTFMVFFFLFRSVPALKICCLSHVLSFQHLETWLLNNQYLLLNKEQSLLNCPLRISQVSLLMKSYCVPLPFPWSYLQRRWGDCKEMKSICSPLTQRLTEQDEFPLGLIEAVLVLLAFDNM